MTLSVSVVIVRERIRARPHDLLRWFMDGYRAELPDRMAVRGIWQDHGEGSRLGSPRESGGLRVITEADAVEEARYTEGDTTTAEEAYRFPMRAALRALAGPASDGSPYAFMARMLLLTARMGGDWNAACRTMGIVQPIRRFYVQAALEQLYGHYTGEPPARLLRRGVRS